MGTFEHEFHDDGTVTWRKRGEASKGQPESRGDKVDQPPYAARKVAEDVYVVSYRAASGYTLTVALNFDSGQLVGFASNDKAWYPIAGTFEEA